MRQHRRLACPKQLRHLIEATKKNRITERQSPGTLPRATHPATNHPLVPRVVPRHCQCERASRRRRGRNLAAVHPQTTGSASFDHADRGLTGNASLVEKSNDGAVLATPHTAISALRHCLAWTSSASNGPYFSKPRHVARCRSSCVHHATHDPEKAVQTLYVHCHVTAHSSVT